MSEDKQKPLRQSMPTVAAWVDELREAFGAEMIHAAIRDGMAGGSRFMAEENGQALGRDALPGRCQVCLADMVVLPAGKGARDDA